MLSKLNFVFKFSGTTSFPVLSIFFKSSSFKPNFILSSSTNRSLGCLNPVGDPYLKIDLNDPFIGALFIHFGLFITNLFRYFKFMIYSSYFFYHFIFRPFQFFCCKLRYFLNNIFSGMS